MRFACTVVLVVAFAAPAFADDGCGKFAWPLTREREQFGAAEKMAAKADDTLLGLPRTAVIVSLAAASDAKFTLPPERKPKAEAWFGGTLSLPAPAKLGIYQVTLSNDAWIDLVQDGRYAHSVGSTARSDCPGVRKSVRFELTAAPFVLQLSGVTSNEIAVTIAPAP